jgi:8-oxo-(d)GTP phosphatase
MTAAGRLIRAAGGVLWRPAAEGVQLALVHRPRYDDWSLPKGKLDPGEHYLEAAVREAYEETAVHGAAGRRLPEIRYESLAGPKVVRYWVMRAGAADVFVPGDEVDGLAWATPEEAEQRLTYSHDADVVRNFARITATATVLLVRHASAGDRYAWNGPDDLRPLDDVGRRQAARLAQLLPLFGPGRVISADPLRCTQTAQPVADRLGVPLEVEPALSETGYGIDPAGALRRIRDLGRTEATSVVCAQGGGIPDIVATLAGEDGVDLPHFRSRKGSVWGLSFRDGLLIAADYYADFDPPPLD